MGSITLPADGLRMPTRCEDGRVELLSVTPQDAPRVWKARRGLIFDAAFLPDDRAVATAGADACLKVWDLKT
jgi:WD40 repeat protein